MNITAIVRALVDAGCSPAQILAAVEAGEAQLREKEEARKELQRERVRRHRMKRSVTSCNVTNVTPPSLNDPQPLLATVENNLNPPPYSPPFGETLSASGDADPVSGKKRRKTYPEQFEAFWRAYPTDRNMSKVEALSAWQKIAPEERDLAVAACAPYRRWLGEKPDRPVIHACRFLSKRRFEGHAAPAGEAATGPPVEVVPDFATVEERNAWVAERAKEIIKRINGNGNGDDSSRVREEVGGNIRRAANQP